MLDPFRRAAIPWKAKLEQAFPELQADILDPQFELWRLMALTDGCRFQQEFHKFLADEYDSYVQYRRQYYGGR